MTIARRLPLLIAFGLAAVASGAAAQTMNVATFLAKAEALQKRGPMALFSKDVGVLKNVAIASGKQIKAEREAAKKAGRTPNHCPPVKPSLGPDEVIGHFRSIPAARRGMSVKDGLADLMRKKYPCPSA